MQGKKSTCIIGIGNPLRSDDGVGKYVSDQIEKNNIPGVNVITTHQLDMGLAEDISTFDRVIFVDASLTEREVSLQLLTEEMSQQTSLSHQMDAPSLAKLTQKLFCTNTEFYLCAIGACNFEMSQSLSEKTINNAHIAIAKIIDLLQKTG